MTTLKWYHNYVLRRIPYIDVNGSLQWNVMFRTLLHGLKILAKGYYEQLYVENISIAYSIRIVVVSDTKEQLALTDIILIEYKMCRISVDWN